MFSYHAFITDRDSKLLQVEADHRQHAVVEQVIADLKGHAGLAHLPSGRFAANAAWLALVGSPTTWAAGPRAPPGSARASPPTLRRTVLAVPARLVHFGRRLHLRIPTRWPWHSALAHALHRFAGLPSG